MNISSVTTPTTTPSPLSNALLNHSSKSTTQEAELASVKALDINAYETEEELEQNETRVVEIFNRLTREMSDREKDEHAIALYKELHPNYLSEETPIYEPAVIQIAIEDAKMMGELQEQKLEASQEKKAVEETREVDENFIANNTLEQGTRAFNNFFNQFNTLYDSGYTPIDLTI
jgi:hypothetical protein